MSCTIGRAALTENPFDINPSGDRLSFNIELVGTYDETCARLQQLNGMMGNPDEDVFPFTWSEDSTFDGFYTDIQISANPSPVYISTGYVPSVNVSMTRVVNGFGKPRFETIVQSVVRTNAHSVTAPVGLLAALYSPSYTWADYDLSQLTTTVSATVAAEDGNISNRLGAAPHALKSWFHYVKPADYYLNCCKIEVKYGSTWYPVVGNQIPAATLGNWRISNGVMRLTPSSVGGNGRWSVEAWKSAAWKAGAEFYYYIYDSVGGGSKTAVPATGTSSGFLTPVILRNTPEQVVVRIANADQLYDFSLQKGQNWVLFTHRKGALDAFFPGVLQSTPEASTGFTGGVRASADNANGLRYLMSSAAAVTVTSGDILYNSDALTASFQIAADYRTGPATTDTTVRDLYLGAASTLQRVVSR